MRQLREGRALGRDRWSKPLGKVGEVWEEEAGGASASSSGEMGAIPGQVARVWVVVVAGNISDPSRVCEVLLIDGGAVAFGVPKDFVNRIILPNLAAEPEL